MTMHHASQAVPMYYVPQSIPGLKVAYGDAALMYHAVDALQEPGPQVKPAAQKAPLSQWLGRLKHNMVNLLTEEVPPYRPIGLSRLTRQTFQPTQASSSTMYQSPTTGWTSGAFDALLARR